MSRPRRRLFVMGDLKLLAGDFHLAAKGSSHPPATTVSGCLLKAATRSALALSRPLRFRPSAPACRRSPRRCRTSHRDRRSKRLCHRNEFYKYAAADPCMKSRNLGWPGSTRKRGAARFERTHLLMFNRRRGFSPVPACSRWPWFPVSPERARGLYAASSGWRSEAADRLRVSLPVWWHGQPLLGCSLLIADSGGGGGSQRLACAAFQRECRGQRDSSRRGGHQRRAAASSIHSAAGQIPRRSAGDRRGPGARPRGALRPNGRDSGASPGKTLGRNSADCLSLLAAGAGAGLAAAFNARSRGPPLYWRSSPGNSRHVTPSPRSALRAAPSCGPAFTGASAGLFVTRRPLSGARRQSFVPRVGRCRRDCSASPTIACFSARSRSRTVSARWPVEVRAALVGAAAGALAWFAPDLAGGGDALTQRALDGNAVLALLPLLLCFVFSLGAASYAAGTPGGLFAPLLVLGAQNGFPLWRADRPRPG